MNYVPGSTGQSSMPYNPGGKTGAIPVPPKPPISSNGSTSTGSTTTSGGTHKSKLRHWVIAIAIILIFGVPLFNGIWGAISASLQEAGISLPNDVKILAKYHKDLEYEEYGGGVQIVGYRGNESTIVIPNIIDGMNVISISNTAFRNCTSIKNITIPDSVSEIGWGAFYGCNNLTEITLPFIGNALNSTETHRKTLGYIFGNTDDLNNDKMSYSRTSYNTNGSEGLTSQAPDDDNTYYLYYFAIPKSLRKVIVTQQTIVPAYAFRNCDLIKEITFSQPVSEIGACAFEDCSMLATVNITTQDSAVIQSYSFENCTALTSFHVPDGVVKIASFAFQGCNSLNSLSIPNTVKQIGNGAFHNCSGLTSLIIPDNVALIGDGAFAGCSNLSELTLPFIGREMNATEERWRTLGYIFGDSDISDDDMDYSSKSSAYSTSGSSGFTSQVPRSNNNNYLHYFAIPKSLRKITVTQQTIVPAYAFRNCDLIKEITFNQPVSEIGYCSFYKCSMLSTINITAQDSAIIQGFAYDGCTSMTSYAIPDGIAQIASFAFQGCNSLNSLSIPNTVRQIDNGAFHNCSGLTSLIIPDNVALIGDGAFAGCSNLSELTLPFIGREMNATGERWRTLGYIFGDSDISDDDMDYSSKSSAYSTSGSSGFTSQVPRSNNNNYLHYFAIPKSLRKITVTQQTIVPAYAFRNCDLIREIIYIKKVSDIGSYAFDNCTAKQNIAQN